MHALNYTTLHKSRHSSWSVAGVNCQLCTQSCSRLNRDLICILNSTSSAESSPSHVFRTQRFQKMVGNIAVTLCFTFPYFLQNKCETNDCKGGHLEYVFPMASPRGISVSPLQYQNTIDYLIDSTSITLSNLIHHLHNSNAQFLIESVGYWWLFFLSTCNRLPTLHQKISTNQHTAHSNQTR